MYVKSYYFISVYCDKKLECEKNRKSTKIMNYISGIDVPVGPVDPSFFLDPETMSSILRSMHAASIDVLNVCYLTLTGSQTLASVMSAILPVFPLIPQFLPDPSAAACFALSSVRQRTTSAPQFYANVLGITSSALASAL